MAPRRSSTTPQQALDLLEIAWTFDPHNELICRDIMRLQERLGQLDAIPRTLTLLTSRLAAVDDRPTPRVISLADRLRHRDDTTADTLQQSGTDRRDTTRHDRVTNPTKRCTDRKRPRPLRGVVSWTPRPVLGTSFAVIAFAKWQLEDEPSADADRLLAPVVDSGDVDWTRLHRPGAFTTPDLGALAARTGPGEESLREFFPRGRGSR